MDDIIIFEEERIEDMSDKQIWDGLMAVRDTGEVNMFDRKGVQYVADSLEEYALVVWLEDHKRDYGSELSRLAEQFGGE